MRILNYIPPQDREFFSILCIKEAMTDYVKIYKELPQLIVLPYQEYYIFSLLANNFTDRPKYMGIPIFCDNDYPAHPITY